MAKPSLAQLGIAPEDLPRTIESALVMHSRWFFTGISCRNGHIAARFVSTGNCMECNRRAALAFRKANLDKVRAADRDNARRYYAADPQKFQSRVVVHYLANRDKRLAKNREWRMANLDRQREKDRIWRLNNIARVKESTRARRLANREQVLAWNRNRKARQRNAEGRHTVADIVRIREQQNDRCAECFTDLYKKGHVDHKIPLARGGSNWPDNLQLLCPTCNCSKGAKLPNERGGMKCLGQ